MRRSATLGAAVAMAALLIGCVPVDPAPTSTTGTPPTTSWEELKACEIEQRTIETAIEAYGADRGEFPDSLLALVIDGWLKNPPSFEWVYTSDGATYSMTGPC